MSGLRPVTAILLAIGLHGLIVAGLLLRPQDPLPEDDAVIDVLLAPPLHAAKPPGPPPAEASSRPHQVRPADRPSSGPPASPLATDNGAWRVRPGQAREGDGLRQSLRAGVGCQSADFLALTKAEQEACNRKLAAGAEDGPAYAVVSPKLKKQFDGVFECPKDDVWCEYRIGKGPYPGLFAPRRKKNPEWD
ncbi:MAG: hypothetical protein C0481_01040 [Phenylobacterium sp.]|uniref:hypothetical protein n=1 Tax=Phenylobacterium sp. TaxID=1871053 RepID=UPI0025CE6778|nr:hypothetical protein [Phenylobacterium sp.]MBA4010425.1 hypothetical protein [Phenylobacterium sp.]